MALRGNKGNQNICGAIPAGANAGSRAANPDRRAQGNKKRPSGQGPQRQAG